MRIGLIDVDSHHFPNLALMKLSAFHKQKNDIVEWYCEDNHYNIVYMSKVFDNTYSPDIAEPTNADVVIKGGTGYCVDNQLPHAVEHIMPDYSLYNISDTAYGFLSRGCPRHCPFCIVGDKEGLQAKKVADLSEWWNGQQNIKLLDPNLLACPDRIDLLYQLVQSRAVVDVTQGFDIRLVNDDVMHCLNAMRTKRLHFAWDNPKENLIPFFEFFQSKYRRKSISYKVCYVLTNYNSTMEENLFRIYSLREMCFDPYVMVYDKPNAPQEIRDLQRWCNNKTIFRKCEKFDDYIRS